MQIKWCSHDFTLGREKLNKKKIKLLIFPQKKGTNKDFNN